MKNLIIQQFLQVASTPSHNPAFARRYRPTLNCHPAQRRVANFTFSRRWAKIAMMRETLRPWEGKPAVAALWAGFLESSRVTDIVLPDYSIGLSKEITHHPVLLDEFLDHSYLNQIQSSDLSSDRKADLNSIFNHNLVTLDDVLAAQQILAIDSGAASLYF